MKRFFGILNLILCFELVVSPFAPQVSLFISQNAQAQSCPKGFQYDNKLNRCLTSQETAKVMQAVSKCGAEDAECYRKNAEDTLKEKEASGEIAKSKKDMSPFMSTVMNAAAIAVPVTIGTQAIKDLKSNCASFSYWAMVGGAAALVVGDLLANFQHNKRLKKIKGDWSKIVKPEAGAETNKDQQKVNATEAQSQAFEMLARSEDSLAKAAKMKSTFYGVAMAAFAAAGVAAMLEMTNWATAASGICTPTAAASIESKSFNKDFWKDELIQKKHLYNISQAQDFASYFILTKAPSEKFSSPSIDDYENFKRQSDFLSNSNPDLLSFLKEMSSIALSNLNPIPEAKAGSVLGSTVATGAASIAAVLAMKATLEPQLTESRGRAIASGVFAGWSLVMFNHTKSQAKASANRATALRKIRDEFKSASGAINMCAPEDRNDVSKPSCYCYTSDGQRNPNRTNSKTCQQLWSGKMASAGTYFSQDTKVTSCIDRANQLDTGCKCKSSPKGCMKVNTAGLSNFNPGSFKMLAGATAPINKIGSGNFDTAGVDADGLVNKAMKLGKVADKIAKSKGLEKFNAKKDKAAANFEKGLISKAGGAGSNLLGSSNSSTPLTPAAAIAELEKEFKKEEAASVNTASTEKSVGQPSAPVEQIDFNFGADEMAAQEDQIAEVMNEKFDYGQSDINEGSSVNIFEVLSNRYQRSGMRRLFDEDGKTEADNPAESDIVK
jgi:hypothetical protein